MKGTSAQFREMFELNVMGVVYATRAVLGDMYRGKLSSDGNVVVAVYGEE